MSKATKTLLALAEFNSWRRGDESLEMPSPAEIGANIDDAVNLLREYYELERELAETKRQLAENHKRAELIIFAREQAIESLQREIVHVNNEWRERLKAAAVCPVCKGTGWQEVVPGQIHACDCKRFGLPNA